MEKVVYEIQKEYVEMNDNARRRYHDDVSAYYADKTGHNIAIIEHFDNEEDAVEYFEAHGYDESKEMRGDGIYSAYAYFLEKNTYEYDEEDEEMEFIDSEYVKFVLPRF